MPKGYLAAIRAPNAIAKVAPSARQRARVKLRPVISEVPTTTPRLGFTVTETVRPPEPVVPDPFIATTPAPPAPIVR
jgi:hypothetical protein